jgi:hypothetical protein
MLFMPDFLGWKLGETAGGTPGMLQYVLVDRWGVPANRIVYPDVNPTLTAEAIERLNFHPNTDGPAFLRAVADLIGYRVEVQWPDGKVAFVTPKRRAATTYRLDDRTTDERDRVYAAQRNANPEDIATTAIVIATDEFGRARIGSYNDPALISDDQNPLFCGAPQELAEEAAAGEAVSAIAYRMVGESKERYGVTWEGPAKLGELFPGATVEVVNLSNTNLDPGEKFELTEKRVSCSRGNLLATMVVNGRQIV